MPDPTSSSLYGNIRVLSKLKPEKLIESLENYRREYGETFCVILGPKIFVYLHDPQEFREILNCVTIKKAQPFNLLRPLIGNGLLISYGNYWHYHRSFLKRAFNPLILQSFAQHFIEHTEVLISKWSQKLNQSFEITNDLFDCIMDIIIDTSLGKNMSVQQENNIYCKSFHSICRLIFQRMTNPFYHSNLIYHRTKNFQTVTQHIKIIHDLTEKLIEERKKFLDNLKDSEEKIQPTNLLDILLLISTERNNKNEQIGLSYKEIFDEVNTFLFAGVETTSTAMSFILYALAKYPKEQERLYNELKSMKIENTQTILKDLKNFPYLHLFIKECLRLYTVVPITGRTTIQETKIGKWTYPVGVTIWINIYGLAHDEKLFPQPYEFKPMRFHEDNIYPYSYIPFSEGQHRCIGEKYALNIINIMIVKILQNFHIELADPDDDLILTCEMTLKSKNGINLILKKRC